MGQYLYLGFMCEAMTPTAAQIDKACREGFFVFIGNRQQVTGADRGHPPQRPLAGKDKVWVSLRSREWELIEARAVAITTERFGEDKPPLQEETSMAVKGKRDGAPAPGRQTGPRGKLSLAPNAEVVEGKPEPGKKPAAKPGKNPDSKQPTLPTMEKRGIKALDEAGARLIEMWLDEGKKHAKIKVVKPKDEEKK